MDEAGSGLTHRAAIWYWLFSVSGRAVLEDVALYGAEASGARPLSGAPRGARLAGE
jgi:hypothetical protein